MLENRLKRQRCSATECFCFENGLVGILLPPIEIPRIEWLNSYCMHCGLLREVIILFSCTWLAVHVTFGAQLLQINSHSCSRGWKKKEKYLERRSENRPTLLLLHFWCGSQKNFLLSHKHSLGIFFKFSFFLSLPLNCQLSTRL